jgi:2-dehydro-3-deoxyglucarate aldolase/4-hydroxy-2-oxoheptanedioate aldolase
VTFAFQQKLRAGEAVYGTMLTECLSPELPPLLAAAGLDFFVIDTEHSPGDLAHIEAQARVARAAGVAPLVRVTDNEYHLIARVLDCGAAGVVAPRINSAAEAREVVAAVKYAPLGRRGYGMRGILTNYQGASVAEAMARQNQETIVVVQVESAEAVDDLPNTVQVPGIDATMVGPNDLSISLGIPGEFQHPKFLAAIRRIAEACQGSPVAAGIHLGDEKRLAECRDLGYRFLNFSADMALMLRSLRAGLKQLKGEGSAAASIY